jgi:hypothetical protein
MIPDLQLTFFPGSSTIASAGYDADTSTLYVNFVKGTCYRYMNVPEIVFQSLVSAESAGKFFTANIQKSFPYERCG